MSEMTVEEMAALCGLTRTSLLRWGHGDIHVVYPLGSQWLAWNRADDAVFYGDTEYAALLALAQHLNLQPKEPAMNPVRYTRIERDPTTDEYTDYQPREGDRWCFSRGEPWTVVVGAMSLYVGPKGEEKMYAVSHKHIRNLTTHIERPVRTVTVPKEGYVPQVGDRFCGPEGVAVLTVKPQPGTPVGAWTHFDDGMFRDTASVRTLVALCTCIERDA